MYKFAVLWLVHNKGVFNKKWQCLLDYQKNGYLNIMKIMRTPVSTTQSFHQWALKHYILHVSNDL